MAVLALTALHLTWNSVDLTDHIKSATLALEAAALDSTAMGDSWVENTGGLKSGTLNIEVMDDFALSSIDATIWAAFLAGTAVPFIIRPTTSAVSTTNPNYTGSVLPNRYTLGGALGELAMKSLEYPVTGAVARATA